ncbi:MAG: hypothetical protein HEQ34_07455 [Sphingorhabdus sp.]|uniref:hypothetical protein n=1 Tax=Sphingorhabdus sp. TaxID=1902408 RepID=UPI0025DFAA14|nr:hypothetical protein [Sphingorhabdus sp.]MCO4091775.1 hypothetical protein [Sphingorhabdus sp.]
MILNFKSGLLFFGLAMLPTEAAMARIVADCGVSNGKAYYAHPDRNRWQDDQTSEGRTIVDVLPDGTATVIVRNAFEVTSDVRDFGGKPLVLSRSADWSEFTIVVAYEGGTVETYLLTDKGGFRSMLMTVTRHSAGPVPPKVSAYVARCE